METIDLHKNYLLIHKFRYPDEDMKQWVVEDETQVGFYHEDWNELHAVICIISELWKVAFKYDIDKIRNGEWPNDKEYTDVVAMPISVPINEAYKEVVKFIEWFYTQAN